MPLFKKIAPNEQTNLYVWKITESKEDLLDNMELNENSQNRLNGMRSELHQRGFLSVRHLLKEAGYSDFDLYYDEVGKPHLRDGKHISITHSFTFSALIISDNEVGIDIERNRDKIMKIAHKFVEEEWDYIKEPNVVEKLTAVWGAKESLFKIHIGGKLFFQKHLPISNFNFQEGTAIGKIRKDDLNENYTIFFEHFEGFTLVYALPLFE